MTTLIQQITDKYQGIAPKVVINAIENAAARTGANFSFLMEKASAESSFNPAATSKSSSATGLFQFIDSTWLNMVKEYGAKYGLGAQASQIQMKDGKPCVDDCAAKTAILNLRKNPEIAALMAGEFSAQNKQYLQEHTGGSVGGTEMYIAHFMGASSAAKFLNARAIDGNVTAASLFPREAHANKNVFFDPATGQPRTLDDIYNNFAQKFDGGAAAVASTQSLPPARAGGGMAFNMSDIAQIFSSFTSGNGSDNGGFSAPKLSVENFLLLAQMQHPAPHAAKAKQSSLS